MTIEPEHIRDLAAGGETLTVEFKGEEKGQISDREVYENVVCLANTQGGTLLIGVENDGRITGARPRHGQTTDPTKLQAAIFNNTAPGINTRVSVVATGGGPVVAIEVDRYLTVCATKRGVCLRRIQGAKGPECVPFYPHEHVSRRSALGLLDFSAQPCPEATFDDLDPLEFERLRQTVGRLHGDSVLGELPDDDLAKALQLVQTTGGQLAPNIAGLLLLGRESALTRFIPTHEAAFQVLSANENVRVNDFFHKPLLATIDELQQRFDARVTEEEIVIGMIRLPVPEYGRIAFREAMLNALLHRDYSQLGTVFIQWYPDHMLITNPGGLPEGVTIHNILVHEPKPRNPRLYDAAKRIGLVEKSGRGVDRIYANQLGLGRPAPTYQRTDADAVRLVLFGGKANLGFAQFVYEEDKADRTLTLDELLVLNQLHIERRIDTGAAASLIQKSDPEARSVLGRLLERGLVEAKGERKGRVYHLSAGLYQRMGEPEAYVRTHGMDPIRQEAMVMEFVQAHDRIVRSNVVELCGLTPQQAGRLLKRMCDKGKLVHKGARRWSYYVID